jgi:molybdopterin converting factor small subunit
VRVRVKAYGPFSLASGRDSFFMDMEGTEMKVEEFLRLLASRMPLAQNAIIGMDAEELLRKRLLLVINDEVCTDPSERIKDGDRIKILTQIAGG